MVSYEELCGPFAAPARWSAAKADRAIVEVAGPDAAEFLHRLCSQDVAALADGAAVPSVFLDAKGKLKATCKVARCGDRYFVETHADRLEVLATLIDRYHFTERLEIRARSDWGAAEVVGADVLTTCGVCAGTCTLTAQGVVILAGVQRGLEWVRAHGPADAVAEWAGQTGLPTMPDGLREALRIASGEVRVGLDSDERTLALEAEIDDHFDLEKGCYTGQEIVARVHTYGHLNRRLKLLRLATTDAVEVGTELFEAGEDEVVARVLSTAVVPGHDFSIGLSYVPAVFLEDPEPLALGSSDGARVVVLDFA